MFEICCISCYRYVFKVIKKVGEIKCEELVVIKRREENEWKYLVKKFEKCKSEREKVILVKV